LLRSASASVVTNIARLLTGIARLLTGSPGPSRINVLTLTPLITTSIAPDLVVRAMLLLAGHGLLMVVHGAGLVFLWLGFLSSLSLTRLHRVTTFLMSSGSFFAFRPPLRTGVVLIGAHCVTRPSDYLDAPAIPANLLRTGVDAIRRGRYRISHARLGKSMLFFSRAIADALESALTIRGARLIHIGTDNIFPVFVLSRCPTRLADVYK
jgi:hypothetical protein